MIDPTKNVDTDLLKNLAIGVFAIVMTLLVLDLKAPATNSEQLPNAILALWPNFLSYAISFALLGIYFLGYTAQFKYIIKTDNTSNWISFFFLALITLIPFSTALLSKYPQTFIALALFGVNNIFIGLALYWHWMYATQKKEVNNPPDDITTYAIIRALMAPLGYLIGILMAIINTELSLIIFAITPLLHILPGMQNHFWLPLATFLTKK